MRFIPSLILAAATIVVAAPLEAQRAKNGPVSTIPAPKPVVREIPPSPPRASPRPEVSTIATPPKRDTLPARPPMRPPRDGYRRYPVRTTAEHWAEPFARVTLDLRSADTTRRVHVALAHAMASHRATLLGHSGPAAEVAAEYVIELHGGEARGTPAPFPAGSRVVLEVDGVVTELPTVRDCRVGHTLLSFVPTCAALTTRELDALASARSVALRVATPGGTFAGALLPADVTILRNDVGRDAYQHSRYLR